MISNLLIVVLPRLVPGFHLSCNADVVDLLLASLQLLLEELDGALRGRD